MPNCSKIGQRRGEPRLLAALLLSLLLCGGCTGLAPIRERLQLLIPWPSSAQSGDPTHESLTVWVWEEGAYTTILREAIEQFQEERAITVELVVAAEAGLIPQLEGEQPPDLILVDSFLFPTLVEDGHLAPPLGRLDSSDDFYPGLVDAFRAGGVLYCLPREVRTLALIYDRTAFGEAGLAPPATWEELRRAAEVLTVLETGRFGLIVSPDLSRWLPFLLQAGGQIRDEEGRMALDSPAAAAALDFYISIFRDNFAGQPAESYSSWAGEVLGKYKGAMTLEGNWIVPYFADVFPDYSYGVAPLPTGPGGRGTVAFTSCYAVTARSQRQDDAFALANFLTSRERMAQWSAGSAFMPTRFSLRQLWLSQFPDLAPFMDGIDEAFIWQLPPGFELFLRSFNRKMVELFAADIDAADLRAEMQRLGEGLLNRLPAD